VVFLATELPQGVMSIATGLFDHSWNEQVFQNVGDFMDMLSLVNSAVNFGKSGRCWKCKLPVIYCTMSAKFRQVFAATFMLNEMHTCLRRIIACLLTHLRPPSSTRQFKSSHSIDDTSKRVSADETNRNEEAMMNEAHMLHENDAALIDNLIEHQTTTRI
jgi:hypothetical protein